MSEYYQRMKRRARNSAIFWQIHFDEYDFSLEEVQAYLAKLGKRYGLLKEFRENGII